MGRIIIEAWQAVIHDGQRRINLLPLLFAQRGGLINSSWAPKGIFDMLLPETQVAENFQTFRHSTRDLLTAVVGELCWPQNFSCTVNK